MAATKYGKYIIKGREAQGPPEEQAIVEMIAYLDDKVIKGAFYTQCTWFSKKSEKPGPPAHVHGFDEVLAFLGSNPADRFDLGGEVEIWLGDEKHVLTESCLVYIPKGMKHSPINITRVDRPILHFSTGPGRVYDR